MTELMLCTALDLLSEYPANADVTTWSVCSGERGTGYHRPSMPLFSKTRGLQSEQEMNYSEESLVLLCATQGRRYSKAPDSCGRQATDRSDAYISSALQHWPVLKTPKPSSSHCMHACRALGCHWRRL